MEALTSYSFFALYNLDDFPVRILSALAELPPLSSVPLFPSFDLHVLHAFGTLPMRCPFFPLCFTSVHQLDILFFFLQDLRSSSPCCGLRDLTQELSTAFRTLDHLIDPLLMHFFILLFSSSFFHRSYQTYHFRNVSSSP